MDAPESTPAPFPDPIPGIIPFGTLTIVAGAPGVGKTAMLAEWIQRWRTGRTIWGKPTNAPTAFYYLAADRQWKSHQLWFDAVGYPDIPHYSLADDRTFDLNKLKIAANAIDTFRYCLDKLKPIPGAHVFADPVSPLYIAGDSNKARDVAVSLLKISRVSQEYEVNITASVHFGKQKTDSKDQYARPQDRIAGSMAFAGFSDTQVYLIDPIPNVQPYHVCGWVPRHAPTEQFKYVRSPETGLFVPYELYEDLAQREAAIARALMCIPFDETSSAILCHKIQMAADCSIATAKRYLQDLVQSGKVEKLKRGLYRRVA